MVAHKKRQHAKPIVATPLVQNDRPSRRLWPYVYWQTHPTYKYKTYTRRVQIRCLFHHSIEFSRAAIINHTVNHTPTTRLTDHMFSANENLMLRQHKRRIVDRIEKMMPEEALDMGTTVMVMQVACKAPGWCVHNYLCLLDDDGCVCPRYSPYKFTLLHSCNVWWSPCVYYIHDTVFLLKRLLSLSSQNHRPN